MKTEYDGEFVAMPYHCAFFDTATKKCLVYADRRRLKPLVLGVPCATIAEIKDAGLLPCGCGYRKVGRRNVGLKFDQAKYDALPETVKASMQVEYVEDVKKVREYFRGPLPNSNRGIADRMIARADAENVDAS